jgi:hypothetical protein
MKPADNDRTEQATLSPLGSTTELCSGMLESAV